VTTAKVSASAAARKRSWRDIVPPHEAALAYPRLPDSELASLADDIKARGQQVHVVLYLDKSRPLPR